MQKSSVPGSHFRRPRLFRTLKQLQDRRRITWLLVKIYVGETDKADVVGKLAKIDITDLGGIHHHNYRDNISGRRKFQMRRRHLAARREFSEWMRANRTCVKQPRGIVAVDPNRTSAVPDPYGPRCIEKSIHG